MNITADQLRVGYQYLEAPSEDSLAVLSDVHGNGPTQGDTHWSSCLVHPQPDDAWGAEEVVLCVTVRRPDPAGGVDRGRAMVLARYRQSLASLQASVDQANAGIALVDTDAAHLSTKLDTVLSDVRGVGSATAHLSNGISAVNALGQILAGVDELNS